MALLLGYSVPLDMTEVVSIPTEVVSLFPGAVQSAQLYLFGYQINKIAEFKLMAHRPGTTALPSLAPSDASPTFSHTTINGINTSTQHRYNQENRRPSASARPTAVDRVSPLEPQQQVTQSLSTEPQLQKQSLPMSQTQPLRIHNPHPAQVQGSESPRVANISQTTSSRFHSARPASVRDSESPRIANVSQPSPKVVQFQLQRPPSELRSPTTESATQVRSRSASQRPASRPASRNSAIPMSADGQRLSSTAMGGSFSGYHEPRNEPQESNGPSSGTLNPSNISMGHAHNPQQSSRTPAPISTYVDQTAARAPNLSHSMVQSQNLPQSGEMNTFLNNSMVQDQNPVQSSRPPAPLIQHSLPQSGGTPVSSSPSMAQSQIPLQASRPTVPPNKRQRTQEPVMPSLKPRIQLIKAHIASVGGTQNLNNGLERPRFQLLQEACENQDVFYVVLHQLFCVWDFNSQELAGVAGLPMGPALILAFKIVGHLIRDNQGLAPNHLKWFSLFPSPLKDLLRTSEPYRRTVNEVGFFLTRLASDWGPLSKQCQARGYPPLVDELVNRMGLLSPVLQGIVFTATRRNLGLDDVPFGNDMEEIFREDKMGHQELALRYNTARPPTANEVKERNQKLVDKYMALSAKLKAQQRMPGPPIPGPTRSSSAMSGGPLAQPPIVPSNVSSDSGATPYSAQAPYPDPNWQSNQATQPVRTTTSGSPNPSLLTMTGRPPSVTGQRIYADTPSPTFMQNLSMQSPAAQSPVQQNFQFNPPIVRSNSIQMQPNQNPIMYSNINQNGVPGPQVSADQIQLIRSQVAMQQQQQIIASNQQHQQHEANMQHQHEYQQRQLAALQQQNQLNAHRQGGQMASIQHQQPQLDYTQQLQHQAMPQLGSQGMQIAQQQMIVQQQQHPQIVVQQQQPGVMSQQQQALYQHQQRQIAVNQQQQMSVNQVLSMNRAAALRSAVNHPQSRNSTRNNSTSSTGRPASRTPSNSNLHIQQRLIQQHGPAAILTPDAVIAAKIDVFNRTEPLHRPLVPPTGYVHPSQPINPEVTALHQAHVRSPYLVPVDLDPTLPEDDPFRRFYQCVKGFAMPPTKIPQTTIMLKENFVVEQLDYSLIAVDKWPTTDRLATREVRQGSLQYRLRCIQTQKEVPTCGSAEWIVSETVWPETVFLDLNDTNLEVRRKNHHGKDLPIDITRYILPPAGYTGSINKIKMAMPRLRKTMKDMPVYFVAVEIVEVLQHQQILDMCHQNHISASITLNAIKKSLAGPTDDDDDDFAMVVSDLSIDLADPFTARIFEIPVRGSSCLHRECFDLETFLLTRNSKPKRPQQPCMVDVWKCPLCGKDARPYSLQIDDFLASVRTKLVEDDNLDVKAILISADGTWRPKPEPIPLKRKAMGGLNDDDESSTDEEGTRKQKAFARSQRDSSMSSGRRGSRQVEVIELDDD
jgi:hypothetical protein